MFEIEIDDFETGAAPYDRPDTRKIALSADRIFLRLGTSGALGADERQWILYREGKPVAYVRSTKAVLARCIREKDIELSSEGRAALDALADDFDSWKADPGSRGTPIALNVGMPLEAAKTGLAGYPGTGGRITMIERLGPNCAIGTDGAQWIVFRAQGRRCPRASRAWQGDEWAAVGYIHSSKRALVECIEANGLKLSDAGRSSLSRQDARIYRWRREVDGRMRLQ
jgi:hypothetical protein